VSAPTSSGVRPYPRRHVPAELDPTDTAALARAYEELEARPAQDREELERLVLDWDELESLVEEAYCTAYADMTGDTTRPDFKWRYTAVAERALPLAEERRARLEKKVLGSPAAGGLGAGYDLFLDDLRVRAALFRGANVALRTEELRLGHEFEQTVGRQQVRVRGETLTVPEAAPLLESPDRALREEAWRARAAVQAADADAMDDVFDRLLAVRGAIAGNAGFASFRDFRFRELRRDEYTPDDCLALHAAIERQVVPVVAAEMERRGRQLGVARLRPWDLAADPEGRPPLPLAGGAERLREGCARILRRMDPELGALFRGMVELGLLDLESRPGKTHTGYMLIFARRRLPFISMSAAGTRRDVDVLLHEAGHSLHYLLAREHPLRVLRFPRLEFVEVAAMATELLARPYQDEFWEGEELRRALDDRIVAVLALFPWYAMVDAFQHWAYARPGHSADERRAAWRGLEARFRPWIDWTGLEHAMGTGWQFHHLFTNPFYFVEYAIAQLGALRIWLASLGDERGTLERFRGALALGATRPLPELFRAAGIEMRFDEETVREVVQAAAAQVGVLRGPHGRVV
jgi:oligoendopeptidase F